MVLKGIGNYIRPLENKRNRPMLNEIPYTTRAGTLTGYSTGLQKKKAFWNWFKTRPELNAPVLIRVDDTITEVEFLSIDGTPLGRNKLLQAEQFWSKNQLYERLKSMQFDRLVTGSGFLWKGTALNQRESNKEDYIKELKNVCYREAKAQIGDVNLREQTDLLADKLFLRAMDEDVRKIRNIDYVASATLEIIHDNYDIIGYRQNHGGNWEEFTTEEIVHIPLSRIDGRVDGFTPVESLNYELLLLWTIKENMLGYFRNGGVPSRLFILPEEIANSENHAWLTQELMNKGILENRHGNLVLTGQIEVKELEDKIKDMEYKELALYVTSNIAYALRVPVGRIPYLIGSAASGSDAGGLSESGYWAMIESDQRTIEMHLNQQIFNQQGFSIKFKRNYKIDDVREAQAANQWIAFLTQADNLYRKYGKKIKVETLTSLISGNRRQISVADLDDLKPEEMVMGLQKNSMLNQTFMKDKEVMPNQTQQTKNDIRKNEKDNDPKRNDSGV